MRLAGFQSHSAFTRDDSNSVTADYTTVLLEATPLHRSVLPSLIFFLFLFVASQRSSPNDINLVNDGRSGGYIAVSPRKTLTRPAISITQRFVRPLG